MFSPSEVLRARRKLFLLPEVKTVDLRATFRVAVLVAFIQDAAVGMAYSLERLDADEDRFFLSVPEPTELGFLTDSAGLAYCNKGQLGIK